MKTRRLFATLLFLALPFSLGACQTTCATCDDDCVECSDDGACACEECEDEAADHECACGEECACEGECTCSAGD